MPATVSCARIPGVNIVYKFKLFVRALETRRKASFFGLFRNEYIYKSVAYLLTMHVYCVYHAMSKVQTTFYFWKIAETSGLLIIFWRCPLWSPHVYLYYFWPSLMNQKISKEQTISMQLCPGIYPVMQLCTNPQTEGHSFTWDIILFYIIQDKVVHN